MDPPRARVAGIDIDGVLADPSHRLHHLDGRPKDWRAFFAAAPADLPLNAGIALVRELIDEGITVLYVTGRPEYLRTATQSWLRQQGLPDGPLHLRPRRDFRPAPILKRDVYRRIAAEFDLVTIVDDDSAVVDELRAAGFSVRFADWFRPPPTGRRALADAQDEEGRT